MRNSNIVFEIIFSVFLFSVPLFAGEKVAVVLSGGGAQAMAHIGVLRAFEEEQIPIDYLIGSSGGSIIGGLYAAGVSLDELDEMARNGTIMKLFLGRKELTDLPVYDRAFRKSGNFSIREYDGKIKASPGLLNDNLIWKELFLLTAPAEQRAHSNFDSLLIPFRAIGADLVKRKAVAIGSGSLAEALRISMSMPLIYPPVIKGNKMFLDGGIYAKMPVFAAQDFKADLIVAVNAGDPTPQANEIRDVFDFFDTINALLFSYSDSNNVKGWDYYINVDTEGFNVFDFAGGEGLIARGYSAGKKAAKKISRVLNRKRDMTVFHKRQYLFRTALDDTQINSVNWINKNSGKKGSARFKIDLPFTYSAHKINSLMNALYASGIYESIIPMLSAQAGQLNLLYQRKTRWSATPEIKISSVDGFYLMTNIEYHPRKDRYLNRLQAGIGNRRAEYRYSFSPTHFWYADNTAQLNYFWEFTHSFKFHSYRVQNLAQNDVKYYDVKASFINHLVLSWNQEIRAGAGIQYSYWRNINQAPSVQYYTPDNPTLYPFIKLSYQFDRLKRTVPFTRGWKIASQVLAGGSSRKLFYSFSVENKWGIQLNKRYHFGLDVMMQTSSAETPLEMLANTEIPLAYSEIHFFNRLAYSGISVSPALTRSFFRNDLFLTVKSLNSYLQKRIINGPDDWSFGYDTFLTYNSILGQLQLGWSFWSDNHYQILSWTKVHIYL